MKPQAKNWAGPQRLAKLPDPPDDPAIKPAAPYLTPDPHKLAKLGKTTYLTLCAQDKNRAGLQHKRPAKLSGPFRLGKPPSRPRHTHPLQEQYCYVTML